MAQSDVSSVEALLARALEPKPLQGVTVAMLIEYTVEVIMRMHRCCDSCPLRYGGPHAPQDSEYVFPSIRLREEGAKARAAAPSSH